MSHASLINALFPDLPHFEPVSGGSINQCYKIYSGKGKYFLKVNDRFRFPGMFSKEASGLLELKSAGSFKVPRVIGSGVSNDQQYLILEWLEQEKNPNWEKSGRSLALMHQKQETCFGFHENNFIGSLTQINTRCDSWKEFFRESRILPLEKMLEHSFNKRDRERFDIICDRIDDFFPTERASLLHGDLWSGNFMSTSEGPCIFDPAVYYGHREMDIGMTKLFGGFPETFYNAYNEVYPLEKSWTARIELAQLYPLLVHAKLFGGAYVMSVKNILKKYS